MKTVVALFLLLGLVCSSPAADTVSGTKKPYVLYVQFLQDTRVDLSDGAVWLMEKGDCFPVYMFKDHQTKAVLQLASTTFPVDMVNLKVLPEKENQAALESYRKNLTQYLNGRSAAWKRDTGVDKKEKQQPVTP